jgi:hypothetical protein
MSVETLIQIRRGTSTEWNNVNPTLSAGEWGLETNTGRYKIGDGLTTWTSLDYAAVTPDSFVQGTGIGLTQGTNGSTLTVAVTGISSSLVTDFNSAVSAIVATGALSASEVMDIVGTGIVEGSNIDLTYNAGAGTLTIDVTGVSLTGHTHTSSDITDFNSSVSGLLPITSLSEGTGIGITNIGTDYTISVTGITSSLVSDFSDAVSNVVDTDLVQGTGISITYNSGTNELTIATTGVSFVGHTHTHSDITDFDNAVSEILTTGNAASATEATNVTVAANNSTDETVYIAFVDGATGSQGIETDTSLTYNPSTNKLSVGSLDTAGNVTIGGDLTVAGNTTTVNSTTVEIGDNIIRVNTSGLTTGGFEVFDGTNYQQLIYNVSNSRWEISTDLYTSGNFVGDLTGNADTVTNGIYSTDTGTVTSTMILDGTIVDADINSSANINVQKLASGSTGQVLQVSATGIIWGGIDGGTP